MKKQIYSSIGVLAALQVHSQITLTQAANAPAPGDVQSIKLLDSTAALDKSGGASKTWNYSTSVTNSTNNVISTISYTTASSIPGASQFVSAGANVAATDSSEFYKSTASSLEFIGSMDADGSVFFLSNPMKIAQFPFTYPNSYTDPFSGTMILTNPSGTLNINGNLSVSADGYGTVILPSTPSNLTFNNVLRVKETYTATMTGTVMNYPATGSVVTTQYLYFKSGTKNPFFYIEYQKMTFPPNPVQTSARISYDASLPVNVEELHHQTPVLFIYPNPSDNILNIQMNKADFKTGKIMDIQGKTIKEFPLKNNNDTESINIQDLNQGTYILLLENSPSGLSSVSYKFMKK